MNQACQRIRLGCQDQLWLHKCNVAFKYPCNQTFPQIVTETIRHHIQVTTVHCSASLSKRITAHMFPVYRYSCNQTNISSYLADLTVL